MCQHSLKLICCWWWLNWRPLNITIHWAGVPKLQIPAKQRRGHLLIACKIKNSHQGVQNDPWGLKRGLPITEFFSTPYEHNLNIEIQILLKYFSNFQNLSFPKILKNMKFLEIFGNTISKCPNFIGNIKPNCLQSCPCIDLKLLINHYESPCIWYVLKWDS